MPRTRHHCSPQCSLFCVRLLGLALALWTVLWAASVPVVAQLRAPLTLAAYRDELLAAMAELERSPPDQVEAVLQVLQENFTTITQIQLPNADVVEVVSILDNLDASTNPERARDLALTRLAGALAQMDAAATDNTAARLDLLGAILARPEFNAPQSLWDRFWQWLQNWLSALLPDSEDAGNAGWLGWLIRLVPWLVTILIVAAVIWLLSYWLQRLLRSFVTDARLRGQTDEDDLPATAAEARQQARAAAESGHYRDAVRRLYLAALLQLAEHDLISYERSLTNREVLVRVPTDSPVRSHLEPVVATFDQVWYGVREPDLATFNAYEAEIDALAAVAEGAAQQPHPREAHQSAVQQGNAL